MLKFLPTRLLWNSLNWLSRLAIAASAVMAFVVAIAVILLRYWLLPDIEQYHDRITDALAGATGMPAVTVGKISGEWRGFHPHLKLTDVRILNRERKPVLELKNIDASISWMSLLTAEFRLAELDVANPELLVRRDVYGNFFLGDFALSSQGGDNAMADWLLHQSRIVVRDALIVWVDEQRNASPLILNQVNLLTESLFNNHRFALHARPPEELATPLDVRGDLIWESFDDPEGWHGRLFTQLDYTDVTSWRPWFDLPGEFKHGRGAIRGWLGIEKGKLSEFIADINLRDVITKLSEDVPEMLLLSLRGRAAWRDVPGGMVISTEALSMRFQNGIELKPVNFYYLKTLAEDEQPASSQIRANLIELAQIASIAEYIPLPVSIREQISAYAPSGIVTNLNVEWQGALENPDNFKIRGQLDDIAVKQVGKMPGLSGLTADMDGNETRGRLNITSRHLMVDAPGVMREPLFFTIATGQAGWRNVKDELRFEVDNLTIANDDLAGNLYGSYQTRAGTLGDLDLTGRLSRGDISSAARYTPLIALNLAGNDWLNNALVAGHTENFRIRIKGNLSDFPIKGNKPDVLFKIGGHVQDGILEFDKEWPRIENIDGDFLIRGNLLEINPANATMDGARLQNVVVTMPDMTSDELALQINGDAQADNDTFLKFVQHSPVRGYLNGFTDGMSATGGSHLALFARIPLNGDQPVKVAGNLSVKASDIDLGAGVPWLRNTNGVLTFTESEMQAKDVSADILGEKAVINLGTVGSDTVHATVRGRIDLAALRMRDRYPLLNYLHGGAAWDADISVVNSNPQIVINSDLVGIRSVLPAPFAKQAREKIPLHFESRVADQGQDEIFARLGNLLNARLELSGAGPEMAVKRGVIGFGSQVSPEQMGDVQGVWLIGNLPELSLQDWGGLMGGSGGMGGSSIPLAGANLVIGKVSGFGMNIEDLSIEAAKRGEGFSAELTSNNLNGEVDWQPYNEGKLTAKLKNLSWSGGVSQAAQPIQSASLSPGELPAVQIAIENLMMRGESIGRFDLVGHPDGQDWRMRRFNFTNADGSLTGDGIWKSANGKKQTELNLQLSIVDAGKTLARSGYPDTVKGGSGKLMANLSWDGAPDKFSYESLAGTLKLDAGKGRFLKMDPGAGKLLSILSLQALPKHISLDFTDVFSEGFQFDSIKGNANINKGVIDTRDFSIDGSSARVTLKGSVDLKSETQNIRVKVMPTIGDSVSLLGAFAAGPAVGIGALIVNKVLGNPLDKLVSFEYNVDGAWNNPNVTKINRTTPNNFLNE